MLLYLQYLFLSVCLSGGHLLSCLVSVRANDVARASTTRNVRARLQGDDQEGEETKVSRQCKQKYLPRSKFFFCTRLKCEHATLSIQINL